MDARPRISFHVGCDLDFVWAGVGTPDAAIREPMILLQEVSKHVFEDNRKEIILAPVSLQIPSHCRIALVAPSERDGEVFIELLAGVHLPSTGRIIRRAKVSFPV